MQRQWPALPESNTESLALWARQITRLLTEGVIANSGQFAEFSREVLGAARTYYVRTDGNDSNAGDANTAAGAFLTVQKALDVVYGMLDLSGNNVTIQLADGTYGRAIVTAPQVGKGTITLQGNSGTPANVILTATGIGTLAGVVEVTNFAVLTIKDITLQSVTSGSALVAGVGGVIYFQNIRFGAVAGGSTHILASQNAYIQATGDYAITGGALRHWWANSVSEVRVQSRTITITGTPAFTGTFCRIDYDSVGSLNGNTFSGSATGVRFQIQNNGVLAAFAGLTEFPGNADGTVSTGGIHAALVDYVTDAQVRAATAGRWVLTADKLESASALVTLTDAATIAVDWDAFINGIVQITANRIIGNPTNGQPGTWRTIYVNGNDATDRTITFGTQFLGELPVVTDIDSGRHYLFTIFCATTTHFVVSAKRAFG